MESFQLHFYPETRDQAQSFPKLWCSRKFYKKTRHADQQTLLCEKLFFEYKSAQHLLLIIPLTNVSLFYFFALMTAFVVCLVANALRTVCILPKETSKKTTKGQHVWGFSNNGPCL